MKNKMIIITLIVTGVISRLIPHPPNFTPVTALILLTGSYFSRKWAILVAFSIMIVSDVLLGFHSTMIWVYTSFVAIAIISQFLKNRASNLNILRFSFASSLLFYIVTNFGVWYSTDIYTKDLSGLIECYILALPFFKNTLLGDLFYSLAVFKAFKFVKEARLVKFLNGYTLKNFFY